MEFDVQHHTRTLALRAPSHLRVGPFTCRFNLEWASPFANYAIPDDHAEPDASDVRGLISAFEAQDRLPRLEYFPKCAPAVEKVLLDAGFEVESRAPLMACPPESLVIPEPVPGLEFLEPRSDEELDEVAAVQHRAFGEPGEPQPGNGRGLRRTYENGGIALLGRIDGEPVTGGSCSAPVDGLTEIGGVAVAESFRRRGIGAALSARLTQLAYARGYRVVWLEPEDASVERVYARIGFRPVGEKLSIRMPEKAA